MARPDTCTPEDVSALCRPWASELSPEQCRQICAYVNMLMQWNASMNLVGTHRCKETLERLVLDSFFLAEFLRDDILPNLNAAALQTWDLGAGAGLPGLPLRMLWHDGDYWLIDSREKRTIFLSAFLARVPLAQTHVHHGRAELFMQKKQANIILSRAFMPWRQMLDFVQGHLRPGGRVIFLTKEEICLDDDSCWHPAEHKQYVAGGETRHFHAFKT